MATPANPLQQKKPSSSPMDMMLGVGGLPAAQSGQQKSALAQMLGPGANLSPYLRLGGPEYADMLDQMAMNPLNAWF